MSKKRLHILFLNSWYPSKVFLYNGDFIQRHAESVATKHEVTSIHVVTDKSIKKNYTTEHNINGVRTLITYTKHSSNIILKLFIFLNAYKKLINSVHPFNIVHVNRLYPVGIIAVLLKIFSSKPFIISEHFTGYLKPFNKQISKPELLLSKIIVSQAQFVCPVSNNLAENMKNMGLLGNYAPIPNVVNTNIFKPSKVKNKTFILIHVSSLIDKHKNISGILNVIADLQNHIDDFKFILLGNQPDKYQQEINSLQINPKHIALIDQVPHNEVVHYLQKSDVLVMFSDYENLPCIILEAFACGTQVISTNVGGIHEYFPKNFGNLIGVNNKNEMLNAILSLYQSKNISNKNEMHNYAKENFSITKIAESFTKLYEMSLKNIT